VFAALALSQLHFWSGAIKATKTVVLEEVVASIEIPHKFNVVAFDKACVVTS